MSKGNEQLLPGAAYPIVPFIPTGLLSRLYSKMAYHVCIKKNITWFYITMNDWVVAMVMKIVKCSSHITGNVDPLKKVWMLNLIDQLIISWCVSWGGCNHFSRLPLALKLLPWKSMLEQEVMIFTRFRCRMFLKAPHSSMKLLDAPRRCRLRTLIATN